MRVTEDRYEQLQFLHTGLRFGFSATYSPIRTVFSLLPFLLTTHVTVSPYFPKFLLPASLPRPTSIQDTSLSSSEILHSKHTTFPWDPRFQALDAVKVATFITAQWVDKRDGWVGEKDWRIGGWNKREIWECEWRGVGDDVRIMCQEDLCPFLRRHTFSSLPSSQLLHFKHTILPSDPRLGYLMLLK